MMKRKKIMFSTFISIVCILLSAISRRRPWQSKQVLWTPWDLWAWENLQEEGCWQYTLFPCHFKLIWKQVEAMMEKLKTMDESGNRPSADKIDQLMENLVRSDRSYHPELYAWDFRWNLQKRRARVLARWKPRLQWLITWSTCSYKVTVDELKWLLMHF